ncbi:MAG: anti-sigma factor family protein [Pyrinomonadaceae bacterium]
MNEATNRATDKAACDGATAFACDAALLPARDAAPAACDCADVAAYLDGELSVAESSAFESHLASCRSCAGALAEQRRLLCLLDAAFARAQRKVPLPEDFVRVVKARAQTDMRCVRRSSEKWLALALCLGLGALAFALIGGRALADGLTPLRAAAGALGSILAMLFHAAAEAAAGALVILRGLGRYLSTGTRGAGLAVVAALACAALALVALINNYHRERLPD